MGAGDGAEEEELSEASNRLELSWEIRWRVVSAAESHRRHKACLFRAAQAFSSPVTSGYTWPGDGAGLDGTFFNAQSKTTPWRRGSMQCSNELMQSPASFELRYLTYRSGFDLTLSLFTVLVDSIKHGAKSTVAFLKEIPC